jgi:hypothetical protein
MADRSNLKTGLFAMPKTYRIYTIGSDGKFAGLPKVIECADDEEAVAKTMQAVDGHDLEIWDTTRLVARVPRNAGKV